VGRPEFIFEDLGEQFLKNIQRPIRVLRVRTDALPRSRTGTLRQHNW
jgi:class 3 adenylate cyclase